MATKRMIIIGEKESFIIRTLIKKAQDAEVECKFVPWKINDVNAAWEDVPLIALYMEDNSRPSSELLHFLSDNIEQHGKQLMVIGDHLDAGYVCDNMPSDLIYARFDRPVDNAKFTVSVSDYYAKIEAGDFKKSILIVDDDAQYLGLVRQWLKDTYNVHMANSGLQAIKFLGKNKVDLILLDHEMPVTSGPQVLEMLRSEEETKNIPVMFLTGKSDKNSVMAVVALKPEGYFLKTIDREELLEKLGEFFIMHRQ